MKKQILLIVLVASLLSTILPGCLVYRHDRGDRYERNRHYRYGYHNRYDRDDRRW